MPIAYDADESGVLSLAFNNTGPGAGRLIVYTYENATGVSGSSTPYNDPELVFNSFTKQSDGVFYKDLTGLTQNKTYYIRLKASVAGGTLSAYSYLNFSVSEISSSSGLSNQTFTSTGQTDQPEYASAESSFVKSNSEAKISKSILTIGTNQSSKDMSIVMKDTSLSTSGNYYAFGTTLFFPALKTSSSYQRAGLGFFISGAGATGYFIEIQPTKSAAIRGGSEFKFYKVYGGTIVPLKDSQSLSTGSRLTGITQSASYKIDVHVKYSSESTELIAYVNGFKIKATDVPATFAGVVGKIPVISKTGTVGLYVAEGTASFDYVYGIVTDQTKYNSAELYNVYQGQFAKTTVGMAYGEAFVSGVQGVEQDSASVFIEEFGPVAREIRNIKVRYDQAPAFPKLVTTGINKSVSLISSDLSTFNGDVYVLNNAGTYVPLDDQAGTSFAIIGNSISQSNPLEYMDTTSDSFSPQEPITFDSQWIQKYSDAKNLSDWIKSQWKNQQATIQIETFANPVISIGDIITISYPYQQISESTKFLVTNITQAWKEGLSTSITARSIYS